MAIMTSGNVQERRWSEAKGAEGKLVWKEIHMEKIKEELAEGRFYCNGKVKGECCGNRANRNAKMIDFFFLARPDHQPTL